MSIDPALLEPGERVLWSGQPNPLRYMQAKSGIKIMLGFGVLILAEFWASGPREPKWVAALLYLVAFTLLLSPLWMAFRAYRTTYALTDRRALTVAALPLARPVSVPLSGVRSVDWRSRPGGLGDVLFGEGPMSAVARRRGFIAIRDAETVERLVRSLLPQAVNP
jgi:hypothetical protein